MEHEAEVIHDIPISQTLPCDMLVWSGTANGQFTVKSTYKLLREEPERERGESSHGAEGKNFWKVIWKIECAKQGWFLHLAAL